MKTIYILVALFSDGFVATSTTNSMGLCNEVKVRVIQESIVKQENLIARCVAVNIRKPEFEVK